MPDNELWKKLLEPQTLKAGWYLARNDAHSNFFDVPFYTDVITISFDQNINEIAKRLSSNTYHASPITFTDVPKSTLAIRPGSLPEIEDRIVLQSIVRLLAPDVDKQLTDAVYSYRVKHKPSSASLFKESDVLDIPYLKGKTITKYFDPFDPWYAAWPEFDEKSRAAFLKEGFKFLVVTDIAAYFENIQLPILRDVLLRIFPQDQKIVNFLISVLEYWCPHTDQHRTFHRGIPQGTQISSFLGNLFLIPLDAAMESFCAEHPAKYFRYMDDIRLFTREYPVARRALLLMDQTIRSLHLNLQGAKTEILAETPNKEITARLIDRRIDEINFVIEKIQEKKNKLTDRESLILKEKLYEIAKTRPYSRFEAKLIGSQKPLRGLTFRAFHRWLTAHSMLKGCYFVRFLLRELKRNPDYRLTRKLISITRRRSRLQSIIAPLFDFVKSDLNLFPHQHAEILWAFRYLSRIPPEVIQHCEELIFNENIYYYVRSAAALLLSRTVLEKRFVDRCRGAFDRADDANVRIALSVLLMQSTGKVGAATLQTLVLHPNDKVRRVARIFAEVRSDANEAKKRLKFLFGSDNDWILCDRMGILFSMSQSDQPEILRELIKLTMSASQKSPRLDLRLTLAEIASRANNRLAHVLKVAKSPGEVVVRIAS